jgi:hypothetical protein
LHIRWRRVTREDRFREMPVILTRHLRVVRLHGATNLQHSFVFGATIFSTIIYGNAFKCLIGRPGAIDCAAAMMALASMQ